MEVSIGFKGLLIGLMILTGALNTLAYKFQNKQMVYEGPNYKYFFHPYMQATTMFLGQALALAIFFVMKKKDPEGFKAREMDARAKGKQLKFNKFLLMIPAVGDFATSTLVYVALNFIPGSVYQMLRGGSIVTTFIFSITFLKMRILRQQIAGSSLALIGITIVGVSSLIFSSGSSSGSPFLQIMGYILILSSLIFQGAFFTYQQKLFSKYHLQPLEVVGWEGIFGLSLYAIFLPILTFIPCPFGVDACVFTESGRSFLQRPQVYFSEAFANIPLLIFCILGIFSIACFNITGVTITKYIDALARSVGDVARTVLVWGIGLIITITAGVNNPSYVWELDKAVAIVIQLVGFLILVTGNLVYNQIVKIPYLYVPKQEQKQSLLESTLQAQQTGQKLQTNSN